LLAKKKTGARAMGRKRAAWGARFLITIKQVPSP